MITNFKDFILIIDITCIRNWSYFLIIVLYFLQKELYFFTSVYIIIITSTKYVFLYYKTKSYIYLTKLMTNLRVV